MQMKTVDHLYQWLYSFAESVVEIMFFAPARINIQKLQQLRKSEVTYLCGSSYIRYVTILETTSL